MQYKKCPLAVAEKNPRGRFCFRRALVLVLALSFGVEAWANSRKAPNSSDDYVQALELEAGVTHQQALAIRDKTPTIPTVEKVAEVVEWLKNHKVKDLAKFLRSFPTIFNLNIVGKLNPRILWFKAQGVKDIGKFISSYPNVLSRNIEDSLQPRVDWLRAQGVTDVARVLMSHPQIFALTKEKLDSRVEWFKSQGITDIARILTIRPQIFSLTIDNMAPRVEWLKARGVQDIGKMITDFPGVLSLNTTDNLEPSWTTLTELWGFSVADIEKRPMLLGSSNERIKKLAVALILLGADPKTLAVSRKEAAIRSMSVESLLENLKKAEIIRPEVKALEDLNASELAALKQLAEKDGFRSMLKRKGEVERDQRRAREERLKKCGDAF